MSKVSSGWRTATIILGILLLLMIGMMVYGLSISDAEETCMTYCYDGGYESFSYAYSMDKCDCYIGSEIKESVNILE